MGQAAPAAPQQLPNVTRYGGDPNQITLPDQSRTVQTNVNGSGVTVSKYSSATADNTKATVANTQETADNINALDQNTRGYFRSLSNDIGGYSAKQVSAIDGLGSSVSQQVDALSAITAQMVAEGLNTGNISQPSTMFGDQWDPQHGSHVGGILNLGKGGDYANGYYATYKLSPTTSDGTSDTQVSVAQPGTSITLNYHAAAGESAETAKQRARDMYNELLLQAARA